MFNVAYRSIYYIWNGKNAMTVHLDPKEQADAWYWRKGLSQTEDLPESEVNLMNEILNSRKRSFKVPRHKTLEFHVVQRGEFESFED